MRSKLHVFHYRSLDKTQQSQGGGRKKRRANGKLSVFSLATNAKASKKKRNIRCLFFFFPLVPFARSDRGALDSTRRIGASAPRIAITPSTNATMSDKEQGRGDDDEEESSVLFLLFSALSFSSFFVAGRRRRRWPISLFSSSAQAFLKKPANLPIPACEHPSASQRRGGASPTKGPRGRAGTTTMSTTAAPPSPSPSTWKREPRALSLCRVAAFSFNAGDRATDSQGSRLVGCVPPFFARWNDDEEKERFLFVYRPIFFFFLRGDVFLSFFLSFFL